MKTADVDRIIDNLGEQIARDIDTQIINDKIGRASCRERV